MGKLFWKFFAFLFLAQITAVIFVGVTIWSQERERHLQTIETQRSDIELSGPAKALVEAAASTLKYGGVDALKQLLLSWQSKPMPQVYAININGEDLILRSYPRAAFTAANKVITTTNAANDFVKLVEVSAGQKYLLFVLNSLENQSVLMPPPNSMPPPNGIDMPPPNGMPPPRDSIGLQTPGPRFPFIPLIGGIIASLIFAALLAWYFSKPIKTLRSAFDLAAHGNLDVRVANTMDGRRDELSDLGKDFDYMISRLNSLLQAQTRLLHDVSHELRSPLSRLQLAIALLKKQPANMAVSLSRIEKESMRMDGLVGELLTLSRLESGMMALQKDPIDLNELLEDLVEDARFEADSRNITIYFDYLSAFRVSVIGQEELLHRAFENVLRNAIKYSPAGSKINVELSRELLSNVARVNIRDKGVGVRDADLQRIFTPFYRVEEVSNLENSDNCDSRKNHNNQASNGYGLGLAIAKQVIESHGGKIEALSPSDGGLEMVMQLPMAG